MEIYLIRHTTPLIQKGVCYGQTDIDIDESKWEQELRFIQKNIPSDLDNFFSSPLKRCHHLVQQLSEKYVLDDRLKELNFGEWENTPWSSIEPSQLNEWMRDYVLQKPPNGESYQDLHARTLQFIDDMRAKKIQKMGIVTHAGNIRSFLSFILSLPLENSFRISLNYASIISISIGAEECFHQLKFIQHYSGESELS
jgi:alpha-ribazole phosphatase